jgi:hypothetical protein
MKMVRRDLEAYFDLRTGVLDKRVHKKAIGRMVEKYYMDALDGRGEGSAATVEYAVESAATVEYAVESAATVEYAMESEEEDTADSDESTVVMMNT